MLRNLFSLPRRLTSRPRRRALADRLPWIEPLEGRLLLAVDVWTGADAQPGYLGGHSNNTWSDQYNWSIGVPQAGDTVEFSATPNSIFVSFDDLPFTGDMVVDSSWGGQITLGYNVPLTLNSLTFDSGSFGIYSPISLNYLDLGGGTIGYYNQEGNDPLTLNNGGRWSGGTINLYPNLINKGTFTLAGSGTLTLNSDATAGGSLINQGTIIQDGPSDLELDGATNLDNQGTYTFQGDGTTISTNYGGSVTNEASGTITKAHDTQRRSRIPSTLKVSHVRIIT